jgi:hypothetical protein
MALDPAAGRVLRAKYLDWCSARLADLFLRLTPDEIYELAQRATVYAEPEPGTDAASGVVGTELSYRALVELVTEALTARARLPGFEEWAAAYTESPERFDDELLGLWREEE